MHTPSPAPKFTSDGMSGCVKKTTRPETTVKYDWMVQIYNQCCLLQQTESDKENHRQTVYTPNDIMPRAPISMVET